MIFNVDRNMWVIQPFMVAVIFAKHGVEMCLGGDIYAEVGEELRR